MRPTAVSLALISIAATGSTRGDEPERRAVAYLAAEVPRWAAENRCFSCHHDGDASRALVVAERAGIGFDPKAVEGSVAWLSRPGEWDRQGPEGPASDKRLARLSFGFGLATRVEAGREAARGPLRVAAEAVKADQAGDGSWPVEDGGTIGSPATYGRHLATAIGVTILRRDDPSRHAGAIARGLAWLDARPAENVVEAAAVLIAGPGRRSRATDRAIALLRASESRAGGWGPYPDSATEPFDTAIALLALAPRRDEPGVGPAIARGRAALVRMQRADGSWPETTRPAGGESYAQRASTAGWSTLALIATRP